MTKIKPLILQAPWQAPTNVHGLITTCHADFNLALHVGAISAQVLANRAFLNELLPSTPLWLNQTHTALAIDWDQRTYSRDVTADASFTSQKNKVCIVVTADCLPILLTNRAGEFVAAIHAGWRGLNAGIIANTLAGLSRFNPATMLAFIGPAICQECFEIGPEVRESFITKDPEAVHYFRPSLIANKFQADLRAIAQMQLIRLGIPASAISNNQICTRCHPNWFYSYRGNPNCGRMATLVWRD